MQKLDLVSFSNEAFGTIRMLEENGKVLFCGTDVAKSLGYKRPNDAITAHCRATVKRSSPISGKMQEINFIPEGDVYRLITHSKLPTAEEFERWVFDEVLPSIRKHGAYITEPVIQQVLKNPETVYQLAAALVKEHNKVEELTPYANLAKDVMACDNCYTMKEIANLIETGRNTLYNLLRQAGVLSKQTGYNLPLQRYLNSGYFKVKADKPGTKFVITKKGLMFIHKLIKKSNLDNEFDTDKLIELAQKINVA